MEISGIGFCALRGCDNRAAALIADLAFCQRHIDLLTAALKTTVITEASPREIYIAPFREVVYYIGWPGFDKIKIGTSTRLRNRLATLSNGPKGKAHLLVIEPGSYSTERSRHRQFRSSRILGTELFRATPQISNHIGDLRARWPHWLEMSGVGEEWLPLPGTVPAGEPLPPPPPPPVVRLRPARDQ